MMENAAKAGTYESRTESYGEREESFNRRYNESLSRNILGEYDPGTLDIKASEYEKALEGNVRRRLRMREDQERAKEQKKSLVRSLEDMRAEQIRASAQKEQQEKLREEYEEELEDRRVILRYLDLDEKLLFEKDEILHASKRKLLEIDSIRRNLEKEEDGLQKEYKRLRGSTWNFQRRWNRRLRRWASILCMEWSGLRKTGGRIRRTWSWYAGTRFFRML